MKRDKILINISNLNDIDTFTKMGVKNFLVPLTDYSVGYSSFNFEEISALPIKVYVFMNRLLTDEDIDAFMRLKIPKNVIGLIIEDVGLYYELKDKGYELILFQNHLNNNYETVNFWLGKFDSLVLNYDLTKDEICTIVKRAQKPVVLNVFGYPMIMYSRRTLVTNYCDYQEIERKRELEVLEKVSNASIMLKENPYGTAIFDGKISDYRELVSKIDADNVKFYLFDTNYIDLEVVKKAILGEKIEDTSDGFLHKKNYI